MGYVMGKRIMALTFRFLLLMVFILIFTYLTFILHAVLLEPDPDVDDTLEGLTSPDQAVFTVVNIFLLGAADPLSPSGFSQMFEPGLVQVFYIIYMGIIQVVALNALIALFDFVVTEVWHDMQAERNKMLAALIVEYLDCQSTSTARDRKQFEDDDIPDIFKK